LEADKIDAIRQAEIDKEMEKHAEKTPFWKLVPFNKPVSYIFVAIIASANNGAAMPIFGLILAKMLGLLSMPLIYFELTEEEGYLKNEIHRYCLWMTIVACFSGFGSFLQRYMFGTLGNKVTHQIRDILYAKILEKNIGWFDHRDNGPSVITSAMAKDTSLVNGVSTESVGPIAEAFCAVAAGLAFGFYFCWQEALVCLCVSPVMMVGNYLGMKF
jgi:ABC-type multidrug transport system fused ATPase/permease subunit